LPHKTRPGPRLSGLGWVAGERRREVPRLPLSRPVVASQTSRGADRLVPAAAVICLPIATTPAQQPLLDKVGQCSSRLGIMLPSPGEQFVEIGSYRSLGSAAAI